MVNSRGKHKVDILGILLTRFNSRTKLGHEVLDMLEKIAAEKDTCVFSTKIRQSIKIEVSQARRINPYLEEIRSKASDDYLQFADEVMNKLISM